MLVMWLLIFFLPKYSQILYTEAVWIHINWICVSYEGACLQGQIYVYMDAFHWHTMGKSGDTAWGLSAARITDLFVWGFTPVFFFFFFPFMLFFNVWSREAEMLQRALLTNSVSRFLRYYSESGKQVMKID